MGSLLFIHAMVHARSSNADFVLSRYQVFSLLSKDSHIAPHGRREC
jgi:hypothetical protein